MWGLHSLGRVCARSITLDAISLRLIWSQLCHAPDATRREGSKVSETLCELTEKAHASECGT